MVARGSLRAVCRLPGRPPHIHFKVSVPGHEPLTTQLYMRGGEKAIRFDIVVEAEQRY